MKRAITGIVAASLTLGTMAPAAFAATASAPNYFGSQIHVGTYSSNVQALKVQDAGNTTALFPFYYIQAGLQSIGYTVKWDGVAKRLDITTPAGITLDTTNLNPGVGDAGIYINGTLVQRAPFSVANDKGGNNKPTSFMAAYYLNQALAHVGFTNSYDGTGAGWTLTAPVSKLSVQSVTALDADEIQVVYTTKVDPATATDVTNYSLNNVGLNSTAGTPAATDATASLQADGKTVILTSGEQFGMNTGTGGFKTLLAKSTGYVLSVDGVKSADKSQTISGFNADPFTFGGDTTAATTTSVTAKASTNTQSVTVQYSEPVQGIGLYYINGQPASVASISQLTNTVTLTAASNLVAGQSYSFQVINEKDTSGNLTSASQNFTVTSDTTAPTLTSAQAVGDNVIRLTFSKAMNDASVTTAGNIKVLDANGNDQTSSYVSVVPTSGDTTHTSYDVKLTGAAALFNPTTNQANLTVVVGGNVKDSLLNVITPVSKSVTLTLNTTKPVVTGVQYVKPGVTYDGLARTNGAIVLTFNENITWGANTTLTTSQYVALNDNGNDETLSVGALKGNLLSTANNVLILEPQGAVLGATSTETLRFNAKDFTDASNGANQNDAFVSTVDVTKGITSSDTTAPVISSVYGVGAVNGPETIKYTVTDDNAVDWSTVLNTSNYRLNGAALPSGTYVTTSGSQVTINLPQNSVSASGNYSVVVQGIKDMAGNTASTSVTNNVALTDNTSPTLKSATFNADHSLTLAFDESVTNAVYGDFSITDNGLAVSYTNFSVAPGTGADAGKVVVTFAPNIATGHKVTVTTTAGGSAKDAAGNTINSGVSVTAYAN